MSRTMYMWHFFETKDEALKCQKEQGFGKLLSNAKYSKTKEDYAIYCMMAEKGSEYREKHPYVLVWNHIMEEGE